MGLHFLGSHKRQHTCCSAPVTVIIKNEKDEDEVVGEPNPWRFEILKITRYRSYVLAEIQYPDATSFEGLKVIIYTARTFKSLQSKNKFDPHFSKSLSPIARFPATEIGLKHARIFIGALLSHQDSQ